MTKKITGIVALTENDLCLSPTKGYNLWVSTDTNVPDGTILIDIPVGSILGRRIRVEKMVQPGGMIGVAIKVVK